MYYILNQKNKNNNQIYKKKKKQLKLQAYMAFPVKARAPARFNRFCF